MTFHDLWDSAEKLSRLIVLANWGIAGTLLFAFAFTVIAIEASNRKDELTSAEDLRKAGQIANLDKSNLTLRGQVATLETNAAIQQERAAKAEKDLLELRKKMADRILSPEQRNKMLAVLKTRPPSKIVVQSLLSEGREALQYAFEIAGVFREAGWTVTDPSGIGTLNHPMTGVVLIESADMESQGWGDFITRVLLAGEVSPAPIPTSPETRRGNGVLEIWVVAKPK